MITCVREVSEAYDSELANDGSFASSGLFLISSHSLTITPIYRQYIEEAPFKRQKVSLWNSLKQRGQMNDGWGAHIGFVERKKWQIKNEREISNSKHIFLCSSSFPLKSWTQSQSEIYLYIECKDDYSHKTPNLLTLLTKISEPDVCWLKCIWIEWERKKKKK